MFIISSTSPYPSYVRRNDVTVQCVQRGSSLLVCVCVWGGAVWIFGFHSLEKDQKNTQKRYPEDLMTMMVMIYNLMFLYCSVEIWFSFVCFEFTIGHVCLLERGDK